MTQILPTDATADHFVEEYAEGYDFRGDNGDYTPTDAERAMLIDFGHGLLSELEDRRRALPAGEYADLIHRLRNDRPQTMIGVLSRQIEAADALQAVIAERDQLRRTRDDLHAANNRYLMEARHARARAGAAETTVRKMREALRQVETRADDTSGTTPISHAEAQFLEEVFRPYLGRLMNRELVGEMQSALERHLLASAAPDLTAPTGDQVHGLAALQAAPAL